MRKLSVRGYNGIPVKTGSLILCLLFLLSVSVSAEPGQPMREKYEVAVGLETVEMDENSYASVLGDYAEKGYRPGSGTFIFSDWEGIQPSEEGYLWDSSVEQIEAHIRIEQAGLYTLSLAYKPFEDDIANIQRGVLIDGNSPFSESGNCPFPRIWQEAGKTYFDQNGDEKAPKMEQVCEWTTFSFYDVNALYCEPLQFYFSAGDHTVILFYVSGNMAVGDLTVAPVKQLISYEQYRSGKGSDYTGENVTWEAEKAAYRSDRTIRRISESDPETNPFEYGRIRLNAIGSDRWDTAWQSITWEIEAPSTGWYHLSMRVLQTTGEGLAVYRQLLLDGEIPFREAEDIAIPYARSWQSVTIGNGETPYAFYLTQGQHTLSLRVVSGPLAGPTLAIKRCSEELSMLVMDITTIVGQSPDSNFDYELDKKISWLIPTLQSVRDTLELQGQMLSELSNRRTTLVSNIAGAVRELEGYIAYPKTIAMAAASSGSLSNMLINLVNWYTDLLSLPITIDDMTLSSPGVDVPLRSSSFFQRMKATFLNFLASFAKDYDSIGVSNGAEGDSENAISLWIARGREWGELLKQMIDEEFTPATGIRVDVNILPSGSVGVIGGVSPILLSIVSGNSPNIAIGSDISTPVELAIRDNAVDVSTMPGFDELASHFVDGAMEPLRYNGGVYALPETMDFQFMMVRKDVLSKLNLSPPEDWKTLYSKVLPALKQSNYNFYIPITTSTSATYQYCAFYTYLYQLGGDLYNDAGTDTILDSDVSYAAFRQWTQNYTLYNLPREVNVFNHFRTGDIPIFVGGLNEYLALKVAAPELYGKWGISLIPGTLQQDGSLDRSAIGALTTCLMFDKGKQANMKAWEFLQWYMSQDVQYRYGQEIEAVVGLQGRWFTANVDAFKSLPWSKEDLAVFEEAMQWMRNPRNVLGGYITGRQLNNAWTRTVMNGQSYQESLEDAIKDIRSELVRKQKEYGIGDETND